MVSAVLRAGTAILPSDTTVANYRALVAVFARYSLFSGVTAVRTEAVSLRGLQMLIDGHSVVKHETLSVKESIRILSEVL